MTAFPRRAAIVAAVATTVYLALRVYWAAGGVLGLTVCAPGESDRAALASGCDADTAVLGFWPGWGAVGLAALAVGVVAAAPRRGTVTEAGLWGATAAFVVVSFPGHLLFQIPAGLAGRATDWRDVVHRLAQLGLALLLARVAVASAKSRRCGHDRRQGTSPVARWARRSAYAACALPVLGFSVPHLLWVLGIPFGASEQTLTEIRTDLDPATAIALCAVPALGGFVSLGLGMRWGRVLFGRRIPRMLALVPGAVVSAALTAYGVIGIALMTRDLSAGTATWTDLAREWSIFGTELVFLAWGLALSAATWGYHLAARDRCGTCERADDGVPPPAPSVTSPA
ncbi:hypothetical protein [Phytomonospora endophytica]|uniref:Uncharacterized protein n=1 Tax=Phytomonospora endophytica TaxID=714109 RepID=A0A841FN61_9ACTN|nr:hypothetical protein [Phytomonospora endophytica]MBB6033380.1 hypothetical protein [Phytomonospora endophytica]GIG70849.1 hypothetical protein Pen01_71440 [Phytomonospora endophytica]